MESLIGQAIKQMAGDLLQQREAHLVKALEERGYVFETLGERHHFFAHRCTLVMSPQERRELWVDYGTPAETRVAVWSEQLDFRFHSSENGLRITAGMG